ncbi:hypothetical protein DEO72_LG5g607 [Vigna unguiculata]|uniref:Uncharacterized protein n=1 Tax=Vigna unguiculata TaxID=3917 RepID=A0A4D6LVR2_VIGUN|nr:hypothetical protein DEO72_LG5g606 [Vigna unguiculata]QCD92541.1 hypothetical protein DEO72_LG5g607 [Vigna unguiculata]
MNSLQRSSFSFRRQGSSGKIWQDQIQFEDAKGNGNAAAGAALKNKMKNNNKEANVPQIEEAIAGRTFHENDEGDAHSNTSPSSLSKSQNKVHGSFFSSICGLCMNNPSGRD